jgi:hypothetical protein
MATTESKTRQVKKRAFDTLRHLKLNKGIEQHRRGVRFYNESLRLRTHLQREKSEVLDWRCRADLARLRLFQKAPGV